MFRSLLFGLGLSLAASMLQARPATCYMSVGSDVIMDGRCDFQTFGGDGSFQITTPDGRWFAVVSIVQRGVAQGWWNGAPFAGHAHSPLGTLLRNDACWVNDVISVCAW